MKAHNCTVRYLTCNVPDTPIIDTDVRRYVRTLKMSLEKGQTVIIMVHNIVSHSAQDQSLRTYTVPAWTILLSKFEAFVI